MSLHRVALSSILFIGLLAGCTGPRATPTPTIAPQATVAPVPSAVVSAAPQRIEVTLSDAMRIEPAAMTVRRGQPVTFVVTNAGQIEHEFYLGDQAAQADHEEEMMSGGMAHGHSNAVSVAPGATEELTFTFSPGTWLAGCHVPGHYPAGMMATITLTD